MQEQFRLFSSGCLLFGCSFVPFGYGHKSIWMHIILDQIFQTLENHPNARELWPLLSSPHGFPANVGVASITETFVLIERTGGHWGKVGSKKFYDLWKTSRTGRGYVRYQIMILEGFFLHFASKLYDCDLEVGDFSVLSTISLSPSTSKLLSLYLFFFFFTKH